MKLRPDRPYLVAALLGVIAGVLLGLLGGFRVQPDPDAPSSWTLELFGATVAGGLENDAAVVGFALLGFAVVGLAVGVSLTALVRRWRSP